MYPGTWATALGQRQQWAGALPQRRQHPHIIHSSVHLVHHHHCRSSLGAFIVELMYGLYHCFTLRVVLCGYRPVFAPMRQGTPEQPHEQNRDWLQPTTNHARDTSVRFSNSHRNQSGRGRGYANVNVCNVWCGGGYCPQRGVCVCVIIWRWTCPPASTDGWRSPLLRATRRCRSHGVPLPPFVALFAAWYPGGLVSGAQTCGRKARGCRARSA